MRLRLELPGYQTGDAGRLADTLAAPLIGRDDGTWRAGRPAAAPRQPRQPGGETRMRFDKPLP